MVDKESLEHSIFYHPRAYAGNRIQLWFKSVSISAEARNKKLGVFTGCVMDFSWHPSDPGTKGEESLILLQDGDVRSVIEGNCISHHTTGKRYLELRVIWTTLAFWVGVDNPPPPFFLLFQEIGKYSSINSESVSAVINLNENFAAAEAVAKHVMGRTKA